MAPEQPGDEQGEQHDDHRFDDQDGTRHVGVTLLSAAARFGSSSSASTASFTQHPTRATNTPPASHRPASCANGGPPEAAAIATHTAATSIATCVRVTTALVEPRHAHGVVGARKSSRRANTV